MNYYQMKFRAESRRNILISEVQHDNLTTLLRERRKSIRAIHI